MRQVNPNNPAPVKTKLTLNIATALLVVATFIAQPSTGFAQGTAFTYQGHLNDGGAPANGDFDLTFSLWDAGSGPTQVGGSLTNSAIAVSNGLFTTTLDFGPGVFTGADRWLEIGVRTNGAGEFARLSPRQAITATPYAITAGHLTGAVAASQLTGTISANNIGAGSITTVMLANGAVGSNQLAAAAVTTAALADGAVTAPKIGTVFHWYALTITNPAPAANDWFAWSVAAVGSDRVLIGAPQDDIRAQSDGAAYLFSANGTLLATFTNPTPANLDNFGWSVTAVGTDRVLIGAYRNDTGATDAGAAYLFSTNGTLLTTFTNPTPATSEWFGHSVVGVGSDRVLIGAPRDNAGAAAAGAAYLFSTSGTLLTTFTNPTPAAGDFFGTPVAALGNDRVLIGASGADTGATDAGVAYLFSTNGTLLTTFTNPTPEASDLFGQSVAAVGSDRVLVGANNDHTGAAFAGAAYLFSTNGTLLTTFTNPTPAAGDRFGYSVAAVGSDRLLIGAYSDDTVALNAGAAYLFSTDGTLLTTLTQPTPAVGGWFGHSVAAVGSDRAFIGAPLNNTGAVDTGAAYLITLDPYVPGLVAEAVRFGGVTSASIAAGAVTSEQLAAGAVGSNQLASAAVTTAALAAGAVTSQQLAAGAVGANQLASGAVSTAALAAGAVTADKVATVTAYPLQIAFTNPTPAVDDIFGHSVAAVGSDRVLIGAPYDNTGATAAGVAYLFGTNGTLLTTLTSPAPSAYGYFGHSAAAVGSDRLLVGMIRGGPGAMNAGAAYLFNTNGTLLTTFSMPNATPDDYFGHAVTAVGSDRVLIGAIYTATSAAGGGAAYLFDTNGTLLSTFTKPNAAFGDYFSFSLAAVGCDRVLIGAPGDGTGSTRPAAYLFSTNGALLTTFANPTPATNAVFGWSVAAVGSDHVLIGVPYIPGVAGHGVAYLFDTNGSLLTTFVNPTRATADNFGWSVAGLGNDRVLIGDLYVQFGAVNADAGAAYLFSTNGTLLTTYTNSTLAANDSFGSAVAAVGNDRVFIGAPGEARGAGAAYLFSTNGPDTFNPGLVAEAVKPRSITTDSLADGAVTAAKLDPTIGVWTSDGTNVFRLSGNVGIGTAAFTSNRLEVAGMVGATAFNSTSDRAAKQDFSPVDAQAVLAKVAALPITQWTFKEFPGARHLGPMAQDFYAAFGVGLDDKHIATVDADGVALAAIQGLNEKVESGKRKAEALEAENAKLRTRLERLEHLLIQSNKP
jgi:hypothetical protein